MTVALKPKERPPSLSIAVRYLFSFLLLLFSLFFLPFSHNTPFNLDDTSG
jgi:hypothetical protein